MEKKTIQKAERILLQLRAKNPALPERIARIKAAERIVDSIAIETFFMNIAVTIVGFLPASGVAGAAAYIAINSGLLKKKNQEITEAVGYILSDGKDNINESSPLNEKIEALKSPLYSVLTKTAMKLLRKPFTPEQKAGLALAVRLGVKKRLASLIPLGIGLGGLVIYDSLAVRKRGLELIQKYTSQEA